MKIPLEIERKWIVNFKEYKKSKCKLLEKRYVHQGYLASGLRITASGDYPKGAPRFSMNHKTGKGLVRTEAKSLITEELFTSLWPETDGRQIVKFREWPLIDLGGLRLEVDLYESCKIPGLCVCEIEFETEKQAINFDTSLLPSWIGKDITGIAKYVNINLAT